MPTTATLTKLPGDAPWSRRRKLGHYGAALDKENSWSEQTPHAWAWYRELQAMRGSGYTYEAGTLVHYENLAIARSETARTRAAEKLATNSQPATSDEKLEEWAEVLGVPVYADDTRQDLRQRCASHYKVARGALPQNVETVLGELLGPNYVRVWRATGADLATPPGQTYWPGVNPGPNTYSLGGGAWLSERAHLTVQVQFVAGQSLTEFLVLMNVHLFQYLDGVLPSDMTFNWAVDVDDGFVLDVAQLDFTGFGYS